MAGVRVDGPVEVGESYKWVALANTTAATFMAVLDGSIVLIALPAIFRGIQLDRPNRLTAIEFRRSGRFLHSSIRDRDASGPRM